MQLARTYAERRPRTAGRLGDVRYPERRRPRRSQLSQVSIGASMNATYGYGIDGMREMKVVGTGCTETTTYSVWTGMQLATEYDEGTDTRYDYLYGPDSMPLQLLVTESDGTTSTYAYQLDHGVSVIGMTDGAGVEVARYAYDPYGALICEDGDAIAARNPLRYRSYYYDAETGHYYLPARYYDPDTMRFLSPDPAAPSAGDPLTLNGYAYCVGDPVDLVDPDGARHAAGGGGSFNPRSVENGTLAVQLIAHGWSKSSAYAFNAKQRASARHQAWKIQSDLEFEEWRRDLRVACDAAAAEHTALLEAKRTAWETRLSLQRTHPAADGTAFALATAGATCDVLALATAETVGGGAFFVSAGWLLDGVNVLYTGGQLIAGNASIMDLGVAAVGVIPGASCWTAATWSTDVMMIGSEAMGAPANSMYRPR